jgi:FAD/FMN-containing dehydrogenase
VREDGLTRRQFVGLGAGLVVAGAGAGALLTLGRRRSDPLLVNDMHSAINPVRVEEVVRPKTLDDVIGIVKNARRDGRTLAICGSRHAMGGQQFAAGATLVDARSIDDVLHFDPDRGLIDVGAGIEWPDLVEYLHKVQPAEREQWTIPTKQTGADRLTLGGAVAANAHGRSLDRPPFIADVESLLLVNADGDPVRCSRDLNPELFSLVCGGYGLFGLVHSVELRLGKRRKIERTVGVIDIGDLVEMFDRRLAQGYDHGDFQFETDENSPNFLRRGIFSCYRPVPIETPIREDQRSISRRAWDELVYLAHTDKAKAFQLYSDFYLGTNGQVYWDDLSQLGFYDENYHSRLDRRLRSEHPGSEMITETYVPRERLADFMTEAGEMLRRRNESVIYGTIRMIREDRESFLPWAKQDYACVIFNLHLDHTPQRLEESADAFRDLIDLAIDRQGSYYLTYHRWARKDQIESCYPRFREFLAKKKRYDPDERFQSEWYRHNRDLFAATLGDDDAGQGDSEVDAPAQPFG